MLATHLINEAIDVHTKWLRSFDECRGNHFEKLRKSNLQGAACEALIAKYLRAHLDRVQQFEDPSAGGPDFHCTQRGQGFYVEVTSLDTKAVEDASRIPDDPNWKGGCTGSISGILRTSVSNKVPQCTRKDAPTLIAVGILHSSVSNMMVDGSLVRDMLISDEAYEIAVPTNPCLATPGDFVTNLNNALFMAVDANGVANKRQPVSGVVVFGLGIQPPNVIGVVNSDAHRSFDPHLLPQVEFAEAVIKDHRMHIRWPTKKS